MPAHMTALDAVHLAWTCALAGWTLWVLREHRRARGIVAEAEARALDIEERAATRARRLVLTAAKVALRLPPVGSDP